MGLWSQQYAGTAAPEYFSRPVLAPYANETLPGQVRTATGRTAGNAAHPDRAPAAGHIDINM